MASPKRKYCATNDQADAENQQPAAPSMAAAGAKRRFLPPKMAAGALPLTAKIAQHANQHAAGGGQSAAAKPAAMAGIPVDPGKDVQYFSVLYTKKSTKKRQNKVFTDGVLQVTKDNLCTLYNDEGKMVTKSRVANAFDVPAGAELALSSFEMEVDSVLDAHQFRSGACFAKAVAAPDKLAAVATAGPSRAFKVVTNQAAAVAPAAQLQGLHSPDTENALVLNEEEWRASLKPGVRPVAPVVMDPYLCRHLRPHQRQGVQFLWECVMGLRDRACLGAILADDMGLGKTLQVLALVWTALRQGPAGRPCAQKVIIVTPSSLCNNWAAEIRKWLGAERLKAMVVAAGTEAQAQVRDFKFGAVFKVCIISFETMRKFSKDLKGHCGILICDEGHRLKAAGGNKTIDCLLALGCPRRILLTGTPLQNNLDEFFALIDFVNPGSLAPSLGAFKRVYGTVIARSQDRDASEEECALGAARSKELQRRIDGFLLRRTSDLNAQYLPLKTTFTIFCRPSSLQIKLYRHLLRTKAAASLLSTAVADSSCVLSVITQLKKVCNHPDLLLAKEGTEQPEGEEAIEVVFPADHTPGAATDSGKLACLEALLQSVTASDDRVVVVSNSTAVLDIVSALCGRLGLATCRIDGATSVGSRQDIVTSFNNPSALVRVCLLSTRAGGAGLNLIGANHLVLFDSDWNPANDQQAMARIWRDGQQKTCYIYRLLTTGTIDEKIFQRQLMKAELADALEQRPATKKAGSRFTREELRDLFQLNTETVCDTRNLLHKLPCGADWQEDGGGSSLQAQVRAVLATGVASFVHVMSQDGADAVKESGGCNTAEPEDDERALDI